MQINTKFFYASISEAVLNTQNYKSLLYICSRRKQSEVIKQISSKYFYASTFEVVLDIFWNFEQKAILIFDLFFLEHIFVVWSMNISHTSIMRFFNSLRFIRFQRLCEKIVHILSSHYQIVLLWSLSVVILFLECTLWVVTLLQMSRDHHKRQWMQQLHT